VDREEEDCRREVDYNVQEVVEEHLNSQHNLALIRLSDFLFDLFEGEVAAVDPAFALSHESVDGFDGVDFGEGVGQIDEVEPVLVDLHAEDAVLGEVDVLVVQHLLLRLGLDARQQAEEELGQEHPQQHGAERNLRFVDGVLDELLLDRAEVLLEQFAALVLALALERLHVVAAECAGQHVDEAEGALEGLVDDVGEVVLHLLRLLDVHEVQREPRQPVDLLVADLLLVLELLDLEAHVPAHAADARVLLHVAVHLEDGLLFWFEADVHEDGVAGVEFAAEAVEEPVVRAEFSRVLVLDAHEQVHAPHPALLVLLHQRALAPSPLRRGQRDLLPEGPQVAQVLPRRHVLVDKRNRLVYGLSGDDFAVMGIISVIVNDLLIGDVILRFKNALLLQFPELMLLGHLQKEVLLDPFG
jgi:hypothetical protein